MEISAIDLALAERGKAHGYDYAETFRVIGYRRLQPEPVTEEQG